MNKIKIYQNLRGITILLVLFGHSLYMGAGGLFGGVSYNDLLIGDEAVKTHEILQIFVDMIYGFHMPLFMMISGAVYMYTRRDINTIKELASFILKKAKRLLIPYVLVTLLWQIPLKYVSGYFHDGFKDAIYGQLLLFGNSHLWFIAVLFVIFVVVGLMEYLNITRVSIFVAVSCFIMGYFVSGNMIFQALQYGLWFYLGAVFEKRIRPNITEAKFVLLKSQLSLLLYIAAFIIGRHYCNEGFMRYAYMIVTGIIGSIFILYFSMLLEEIHVSLFEKIGDISFDLYLYSDSLNYVILLFISLYLPSLYTTSAGVVGVYIMRFALTLIGAIIVGGIVRLIKKLIWRQA